MNYKQDKILTQLNYNDFFDISPDEIDDEFIESNLSFFFSDLQNHYELSIVKFYKFVYYFQKKSMFKKIIGTKIVNLLFHYFFIYASMLYDQKKTMEILLIPEIGANELAEKRYAKTIFLLNSLFSYKEILNIDIDWRNFNSLIAKSCFHRVLDYKLKWKFLNDQSKTRIPLCTETLSIVKKIFETNPQLLLSFDKVTDFSKNAWTQYIMAQEFKIKQYCLSTFLPWMLIPTGKRRTFQLFYGEALKVFEKIQNFIKDENLLVLFSILMEGFSLFLNVQREDIDDLCYAFEFCPENCVFDKRKTILDFAIMGLNCRLEPLIFYSLRSINSFLKFNILNSEYVSLFIQSIFERIPDIFSYSDRIAKEEIKMMKYLMRCGVEFLNTFQALDIMSQINMEFSEKGLKWKLMIIKFFCHVLNEMAFDYCYYIMKSFDIVGAIIDFNGSNQTKEISYFFDGIIRCISNEYRFHELLNEQDVDELIDTYIDDELFSEKAQIISNLLK